MDPSHTLSNDLTSDLDVPSDFTADYLLYNSFLPLTRVGGTVRVAAAAKLAADILDDLQMLYEMPLEVLDVDQAAIETAIRKAFAEAQSVASILEELGSAEEAEDEGLRLEADARDLANQPPVIRFVNLLIKEAHAARASDIHLESHETGLSARFRIDGALVRAPDPPPQIGRAIVSRIKLLAELDIAERRVPQDGRIVVRLEEGEFDARVSTVPTLYGESVVIRLLTRGSERPNLNDLGMGREAYAAFSALARKPHGIVLVTGPTGSGKTTTLYAGLGLRDASTEKIITVEDPVEYQLGTVTQVPVNRKAGVTFASALRSLLRQDPDVVMIGEMRDPETAAIGIQAAMTGHLVFSTLHTNDALKAITRLVDLGVEPYMVAAALEGVVAQRLVRVICSDCRESYRPDDDVLSALRVVRGPAEDLVRGSGCAACSHTGFRGRTGLFEILCVDDALRAAISRGEADWDGGVVAAATVDGMLHDGWRKVRSGVTTVEEVLRVVHA